MAPPTTAGAFSFTAVFGTLWCWLVGWILTAALGAYLVLLAQHTGRTILFSILALVALGVIGSLESRRTNPLDPNNPPALPLLPHDLYGWLFAVPAAVFLNFASTTGSTPWLASFLGVIFGPPTWAAYASRSANKHALWESTYGEAGRQLRNREQAELLAKAYRHAYLPYAWPWPFESEEALTQRIDEGMTPHQLDEHVRTRIEQLPGITLGRTDTALPRGLYGSRPALEELWEQRGPLPARISNDRRTEHLYVIGKTRAGKTNFLATLIQQDLEAGNGLGVLTPDPDLLTDHVLPAIPEDRLGDVVYFNPADTERPVPFNPLHLEPGENLDLRVDETFEIFNRLHNFEGPRMGPVFRHALYALIEHPATTFLDVQPFLDPHDSTFRQEVLAAIKHEPARRFFTELYPRLARESDIPIATRLADIALPATARAMLCSPGERSLNFRELIDTKKILLFNLADGLLGPHTSQLLGNLVVSTIQLAALSRADVPEEERVPFNLYVDEFQAFTGSSATSYEILMSRGRKYALPMTLAHQRTGQLPPNLLREILDNVGTLVCFTLRQTDAKKLAPEFAHKFSPERLTSLTLGKAYVQTGQAYFPILVPRAKLPPDRQEWAAELREQAIEASRLNWGVPADPEHTIPPPETSSEAPETPIDPSDVF